MKDKDLLEESPKNIFHDLMISKIIKKKKQFSSCKGGYIILSPLFFRLYPAFFTPENGKHNSLTIFKKGLTQFPNAFVCVREK